MPTFTYVGDDARTFPDVGLVIAPGDTVEADTNPDPRFFDEAKPKKSAHKSDPAEE